MNAIIAQILPFLSQEHQQQVATAVDRAKQVTMTELNAIIGVSAHQRYPLHKVSPFGDSIVETIHGVCSCDIHLPYAYEKH